MYNNTNIKWTNRYKDYKYFIIYVIKMIDYEKIIILLKFNRKIFMVVL